MRLASFGDSSSPVCFPLTWISMISSGGGFGQQCISLRKSFPRNSGRVILQDRPSVVENRRIPDVEVMEVDMMKGQPVKGT